MTASPLEDVFSDIESDRFAAELSVAGTITAFVRSAETHSAVQQLFMLARLGRVTDISRRAEQLVAADYDRNFRNPADVAIAVYVWILGNVNETIAKGIAKTITGRDWWWARKVADKMVGTHSAVETRFVVGNLSELISSAQGSISRQNLIIPESGILFGEGRVVSVSKNQIANRRVNIG